MNRMIYKFLPYGALRPPSGTNTTYLIRDNWDDWFSFETVFYVYIFRSSGQLVEVGTLKLGHKGMLGASRDTINPPPGTRYPATTDQPFFELPDGYFSIGTGNVYYETLNGLPEDEKKQYLTAIKDCAYDLNIFQAHENERVMSLSLLRSISKENLLYRLHRLAHGHVELTRYNFAYQFPPQPGDIPPPDLEFDVDPGSNPPSNVHVIIGRNGVGKTRCLKGLAHSILLANPEGEDIGRTTIRLIGGRPLTFSGLVAVSFSAFDSFELPPITKIKGGMGASMVGIRRYNEKGNSAPKDAQAEAKPKDTVDLERDILAALAECRSGLRKTLLEEAIDTLSSDTLFGDANIKQLLVLDDANWKARTEKLLSRLSSGHAVVLLTITRLVQLVEERTIILLDEPEGHLHPPLLSAFVRALSNLLVARNGVAIIATHSPVILQEVPRTCVWHINRIGRSARADRPRIETFGEGVGALTGEIFMLDVISSGYHTLIKKEVEKPDATYESVVAAFGGALGSEAKGIIRGLVAIKNNRRQ